jgi:hypothetical protein
VPFGGRDQICRVVRKNRWGQSDLGQFPRDQVSAEPGRRREALASELDQPADGERAGTPLRHLDRHLVVGAADAAAAHLEDGRHRLDRLLENVSPAAMLGPFRNFQAKLLHAWGRAVLEGRAPHDLIDLVEAYGRLVPAERNEVVRLLVVTTFGATVKPGGVAPDTKPEQLAAELTALAAEAAAGRRGLREGIR